MICTLWLRSVRAETRWPGELLNSAMVRAPRRERPAEEGATDHRGGVLPSDRSSPSRSGEDSRACGRERR